MAWFPRNKVLAPVDFSDDSLAAVEVALTLVDEPAHLCVLNVAPHAVKGDPGLPWNPLQESTQRAQRTVALNDRLSHAVQRGARVEVVFGDPGAEIARFAKEGNFELIVMPSHGRTGLQRILIGSVAERVARLAHCPVLILRR